MSDVAVFRSSCDTITVRLRERANDERIDVVDRSYGNVSENTVSLTPAAARRLGKILVSLADSLDPDHNRELQSYEIYK
jgi:hypothetical protein